MKRHLPCLGHAQSCHQTATLYFAFRWQTAAPCQGMAATDALQAKHGIKPFMYAGQSLRCAACTSPVIHYLYVFALHPLALGRQLRCALFLLR